MRCGGTTLVVTVSHATVFAFSRSLHRVLSSLPSHCLGIPFVCCFEFHPEDARKRFPRSVMFLYQTIWRHVVEVRNLQFSVLSLHWSVPFVFRSLCSRRSHWSVPFVFRSLCSRRSRVLKGYNVVVDAVLIQFMVRRPSRMSRILRSWWLNFL